MNVISCSRLLLVLGTAGLSFSLPRAVMAATSSSMATMASLASTATMPTDGLTHLSDKTLREIRGGFSIPGNSGISVNFGFSSQTFVNGSLVQNLQNLTGHALNITQSVSQIFNSNVSTVKTGTPTSTTFTTTVPPSTQTGTNLGTAIVNTVGGSGVSSLIQNQANNRIIQETRTLNVDISGLQTQLANSAQASQVMRALTPR